MTARFHRVRALAASLMSLCAVACASSEVSPIFAGSPPDAIICSADGLPMLAANANSVTSNLMAAVRDQSDLCIGRNLSPARAETQLRALDRMQNPNPAATSNSQLSGAGAGMSISGSGLGASPNAGQRP